MPFFFVLYNIFMIPVIVILFPWFLIRALFTGKDRHGIFQRIGLIPARLFKKEGCVWFHTVSAGEVKAAVPVIERFTDSEHVAVSVGTHTGYKMVREHFGDAVTLFYLPVDFYPFLARLFRLARPKALVIVETEIWPQLIRLCHLRNVPLALINGRIPPKDYNNYRMFRFLWKKVFEMYDGILVQSDVERQRFEDCGAPDRDMRVFGNTKYDLYDGEPEEDERKARLDAVFSGAPDKKILVIGSTHKGEERIIFSSLGPAAKRTALVVAPRHPERIPEVEEILDELGYSHERRSGEIRWDKDVLIWDTMGELDLVYRYADAVLVGGSWIPQGGHNIIEPAIWGKPVIVGPFMHNFQEIYDVFVAEKAIVTMKKEDIGRTLDAILSDDARLAELGANARACVDLNTGAAAKYAEYIHGMIRRGKT